MPQLHTASALSGRETNNTMKVHDSEQPSKEKQNPLTLRAYQYVRRGHRFMKIVITKVILEYIYILNTSLLKQDYSTLSCPPPGLLLRLPTTGMPPRRKHCNISTNESAAFGSCSAQHKEKESSAEREC